MNNIPLSCTHALKIFLKIMVFLAFIVQISSARQVSFFVPEDHEKYALIDSLFQLMDSTDRAVIKIENRLIRDKNVRHDDLNVKGQYLQYLLKNKLSTPEKVLEYCNTLKNHNDVKMHYFNELLSTLKGDIRSKCFILWKNTRAELSQITEILQKVDNSETKAFVVQYDNNKTQNDSVTIEEPTLEDILGEDLLTEENDNPFSQTEDLGMKVETISRD